MYLLLIAEKKLINKMCLTNTRLLLSRANNTSKVQIVHDFLVIYLYTAHKRSGTEMHILQIITDRK